MAPVAPVLQPSASNHRLRAYPLHYADLSYSQTSQMSRPGFEHHSEAHFISNAKFSPFYNTGGLREPRITTARLWLAFDSSVEESTSLHRSNYRLTSSFCAPSPLQVRVFTPELPPGKTSPR
ncbi:hypothetical protein HMN09_01138400 [Mycena chlorophos]|uniref:Uncharacterized protein n=1 Tax=Mycena chlorophos TaxID=658473 RepID=A0A8H6VU73_MYCCL|nr:hypothetical protein HMN09_01138400 [Mycena chlorophos]